MMPRGSAGGRTDLTGGRFLAAPLPFVRAGDGCSAAIGASSAILAASLRLVRAFPPLPFPPDRALPRTPRSVSASVNRRPKCSVEFRSGEAESDLYVHILT